MRRFGWLGVLVLVLAMTMSIGTAAVAQNGDELPGEISLDMNNLTDMVWWTEGQSFLVSSGDDGSIFQVSDDGTIELLFEYPENASTTHIAHDFFLNRLMTVSTFDDGLLDLLAWDLGSHELLWRTSTQPAEVELPIGANDLALSNIGNLVLSGSGTNTIFEATVAGRLSVFTEHELGLQDIDALQWIPTESGPGFVIFSSISEELWYRVPLDDTSQIFPIGLDAPAPATDFVLHPSGTLVAATTYAGIVTVSTENDWVGGTIEQRYNPTDLHVVALTLRGDVVYALTRPDANSTDGPYRIMRLQELETSLNNVVVGDGVCPRSGLLPRLVVGGRGQNVPNDGVAFNLRIRSAPSLTASEVVEFLPVYVPFTVIGGPACDDGLRFWQIEPDDMDVRGWISENFQGEYTVEPID